jgi:hypothetical protein
VVIDERHTRRLVTGTAADGLVLAVPPAFDLPGPFRRGLGPATLRFGREGTPTGSGRLRVEFFEVPVDARAGRVAVPAG